jgi:hypothetical protein
MQLLCRVSAWRPHCAVTKASVAYILWALHRNWLWRRNFACLLMPFGRLNGAGHAPEHMQSLKGGFRFMQVCFTHP